MAISENYKWRYFFHMTDINNLDSIIKNGLLSTNLMESNDIRHVNIANMAIQERRNKIDVPCSPYGSLHDYVPFYFSSRNPMLLGVINKKNIDQPDIIYLCLKINRLDMNGAIFTDAAVNTNKLPNFYNNTDELNKLNWLLIDKKKWTYNVPEDRQHKMAEVLILNEVNISEIDAIIVYNKEIKLEVENLFQQNGISCPNIYFDGGLVINNYYFYYTKIFFKGRNLETLVIGPKLLFHNFEQLLEKIDKKRSQTSSYHFSNIESLVLAIEKDFCVLPELKGIHNLQSENKINPATVSDHTLEVVSKIKPMCSDLSDYDCQLLILSGYLHDIGKGPKDKWENGIQKIYPDHPADAIPMLYRIFTEEIADISQDEIRKICMLVVYHDLMGEIKGNGRDESQLVRILNNEKDFDLLYKLSLADLSCLNSTWYSQLVFSKTAMKKRIMTQINDKKK